MQPYSSETGRMIYSGVGPEMTGAARLTPRSSSPNLPEKRTGLEPPEGKEEEERLAKKARLEGSNAANTSILQSPVTFGRPFGSLPDAALARYLAEMQQPQQPSFGGRLYPQAGLGPSALGGAGFDPLVGMPPHMAGYWQGGMMGAMAYPPQTMALSASSMSQLNGPYLQQGARPSPGMFSRVTSQGRASSLGIKSSSSVQSRRGDDHHAQFSERVCIGLAVNEDPNWLSELQSYVRKDLLEVCWASREDVAVRNASKKVTLDQVGIRCRFCAHKPPGSRAQRSSAFPSSIPQLYQSFTMMLRDHFDNCTCIPVEINDKYVALKSSTCQGATEAKKYWSYSAAKLGMVDTDDGIIMNDATRAAAELIPAFGTVPGEIPVPQAPGGGPMVLVRSADHEHVSGFLYTLVAHFQRIELLPSERKGNRKSLQAGLPGFGCMHCSADGRFGMSRVFPARRRTLPVRVADMFDHICRCNLCPPDAKMVLQRLRESEQQNPSQEKKFLDRVWERLGHSQANP